MTRILWPWLLFAYASLFAYGLADNARGPLFPEIIKAFHLSDSQSSLFFLVASAAAVLVNGSTDYLRRRFATRLLMQLCCVGTSIGLFAMSAMHDFTAFLIAAAIFGGALGGSGLFVNLMASEAVDLPLRRRALSGLHTMYGISSLIAPLLVTAFYEHGLSWREILCLLAIGPLVVTGIFWKAHPPHPQRQAPKESIARSTAASLADASVVPPDDSSVHRARSMANARVGVRTTLGFALILTLYVVAEVLLCSRLVLFARREAGLSIEYANGLLALFFFGMFAGRLSSALMHFPLRNLTLLMLSSVLGFVLTALGLSFSPILLALSGFAISIFYPVAIAYIGDELGEGAASVISWSITCQGIGLVVMNFAVGAISDHWGLRAAMWIAPVSLLIAFSLLWRRLMAQSAVH